jgi:hypothetical protein
MFKKLLGILAGSALCIAPVTADTPASDSATVTVTLKVLPFVTVTIPQVAYDATVADGGLSESASVPVPVTVVTNTPVSISASAVDDDALPAGVTRTVTLGSLLRAFSADSAVGTVTDNVTVHWSWEFDPLSPIEVGDYDSTLTVDVTAQ